MRSILLNFYFQIIINHLQNRSNETNGTIHQPIAIWWKIQYYATLCVWIAKWWIHSRQRISSWIPDDLYFYFSRVKFGPIILESSGFILGTSFWPHFLLTRHHSTPSPIHPEIIFLTCHILILQLVLRTPTPIHLLYMMYPARCCSRISKQIFISHGYICHNPTFFLLVCLA